MDPGAVQSGRIVPLPPDDSVHNDVATEDHEILRRLIRLLSKSEEDELFAQDARRQPSSSAMHTLHRSKSEGDTTSVRHLARSRSVLRLADTAPLRIARPPKVDLLEPFKEFERLSLQEFRKVTHESGLARVQNVLRLLDRGNALTKAASKMSVHLENVMNYMKQQIDILAQAEAGPPNEVHAYNLSSALSSFAHSTRALARGLSEIQEDGQLDDMADMETLETLAQLAETEARSLKDSRADESLKRMSGIHFRQRSVELNTQFAKHCEDVSLYLSDVTKSVIYSLRQRRNRESRRLSIRTGLSVLFAVVTSMMLSVSVDRDSSTLGLAVNGVWLISLASGIAAGITGTVGLFLTEDSSACVVGQPTGKVTTWLTKSAEMLFLMATALFSVGLCIFAFSSSQAVASRVIIIVFTSLHFLGLFVLLTWLLRSRQSQRGNSDGRHRPRRLWSSVRNMARLSIRSSAARPRSGDLRTPSTKDVEKGLHLQVPSHRRSAPPIIRVTDTEQEQSAPEPSDPENRQSHHTHNHINITDPSNDDRNFNQTFERGQNIHLGDNERDSEVDSTSDHDSDQTSLSFSQTHTQSHAVLAVPSAQRISSDSSRSLPALPAEVQIARCMSYSSNGMFLCIGNASPRERCTIFSSDSPAITLGEFKPEDIVLQIEWCEDSENILLRFSHTIAVWHAMVCLLKHLRATDQAENSSKPSGTRRPTIIIRQDFENVKWLMDGDSFLSCKKDILTKFKISGDPANVFQLPANSIQDFVVTNDGERIICLVSNFASARSGKTGAGSQKLIVYNLEHNSVEQIAPVGRDALTIVRSTVSSDLVLINFTSTTPPQIWRYRQNTDSSDRRTSATFLSFKRAMSFKAPSGRFAGYGIFGTVDDKAVLALGEDGDMFIFASDTGQLLRHVTTTASYTSRKSFNANEVEHEVATSRGRLLSHCVAWDPDILSFMACMGYADGSIWQWKISLGQDASSSAFALTALHDEDSTMIRPPDVVIPTGLE